MNGKSKCKILKDIRRQIAENNDIEYITSECKFQGECSGTCPKCESELRYLESELEKRKKAGKAIAVAGLAAAFVVNTSGCALDNIFNKSTAGSVPYEQSQPQTEPSQTKPNQDEVPGALPPVTEETLMGDVPLEIETGPTESAFDGIDGYIPG